MYICRLESPLGLLTAAGDKQAVTGLWLQGQKHFPALPESLPEAALPVFDTLRHWLALYFAGTEPDFLPELCPQGTDFQMQVWKALLEIPYGKTVTYGQLAKRLGSSPRAVGGAVGRNPISILIPCHRVLGSGGALTGYAAGPDTKRFLLQLEGVHTE